MPFISNVITQESERSNVSFLDHRIIQYNQSVINSIISYQEMNIYDARSWRFSRGFHGFIKDNTMYQFYNTLTSGGTNIAYVEYNFDTDVMTRKTIPAGHETRYCEFIGKYNDKLIFVNYNSFYLLNPTDMTITYITTIKTPYMDLHHDSMLYDGDTKIYYLYSNIFYALDIVSGTSTSIFTADNQFGNPTFKFGKYLYCNYGTGAYQIRGVPIDGSSKQLYVSKLTGPGIDRSDTYTIPYAFQPVALNGEPTFQLTLLRSQDSSGCTVFTIDMGILKLTDVVISGNNVTLKGSLSSTINTASFYKSKNGSSTWISPVVYGSSGDYNKVRTDGIPRLINLNEKYVYKYMYQLSNNDFNLISNSNYNYVKPYLLEISLPEED